MDLSIPPPTELPLRSQIPGGRTLPQSPRFTPTHNQEGQQRHLESTTANVNRITPLFDATFERGTSRHF